MGEKYNPADLLKNKIKGTVDSYQDHDSLKKVANSYSMVINLINDNFNKGKIDEALCNVGFEQLDMLIEKAGHKYIRREGTPGKYKYIYSEDAKQGDHGKKESVNEAKFNYKETGLSGQNLKDVKDGIIGIKNALKRGNKSAVISNYEIAQQRLQQYGGPKASEFLKKIKQLAGLDASVDATNDFEPGGKIRSRLKENLSLDRADLNTFIDSITSQELEDKVFDLFTGWSNSREQAEMYERIERQLDMAGYDAAHLD